MWFLYLFHNFINLGWYDWPSTTDEGLWCSYVVLGESAQHTGSCTRLHWIFLGSAFALRHEQKVFLFNFVFTEILFIVFTHSTGCLKQRSRIFSRICSHSHATLPCGNLTILSNELDSPRFVRYKYLIKRDGPFITSLLFIGSCLHHQCVAQRFPYDVWQGRKEKRIDQKFRTDLRTASTRAPDLSRRFPRYQTDAGKNLAIIFFPLKTFNNNIIMNFHRSNWFITISPSSHH